MVNGQSLLLGTRLDGPLVPFTLAGIANTSNLWQISNAPTQIGVKTFKLRRVSGRNNGAGTTWLHIGTGVGVAFVDTIPPLRVINNMDFVYGEDELPPTEFSADMTAYVDAAPVDVQVEVEEIG